MADFLFPENAELAEAAAAAMQAFEGQQRKLAELQEKMNEDSTTVRSKDRSLSMTFDGRGELTEMKFLGTKFRSMAPAELAHLIVETVQAGRAQFAEKFTESWGSSVPGLDFRELMAGGTKPEKLVETLFSSFIGEPEGSADSSLPGKGK